MVEVSIAEKRQADRVRQVDLHHAGSRILGPD